MTTTELAAGRELDALVAERVMGCEPVRIEDEHGSYLMCYCSNREHGGGEEPWWFDKPFQAHHYAESLANYSTNIAAAWQVATKLRIGVVPHNGRWLALQLQDYGGRYDLAAEFGDMDESAPLAICRAALRAIEKH